jgi:putative transposase
MARLPRVNLLGVPQHIVQRGNNRHACFFSDQDYAVYLDKLNYYAKKYHIHAYLLLTPTTEKWASQLMSQPRWKLGGRKVLYW